MEAGHYLIGFNAIGWPEEYIYPQQRTPGTVVEGEVTEKTFMLQGTSHLLISEVLYDTPGTDEDEEWIEIYNPTASTIDLSHYKVGDEEEQGKGEGMYQFPSGASIPPGGVVVVALKATGFYPLYGSNPDYEAVDTDPSVPDMIKYSAWATGKIALKNTGDEVFLLDGSDAPVDVVVFEKAAIRESFLTLGCAQATRWRGRHPIGTPMTAAWTPLTRSPPIQGR